MRAIIQRVTEASVTVDKNITGKIQHGLVILLGIEDADTDEDIEKLSSKIINLRIFNDTEGVMNVSIKDVGGDILLVSQFTLYASTKKGNRPSFIRAAKPDHAIPLYEAFRDYMISQEIRVKEGVFGADMKVSLVNDGPVTIILDSKNVE